jgi:acyl-CoA thioesterase FadM
LRESVLRFDYRIFRASNQEGKQRELLAEGETAHVVCDGNLERKPLPKRYAAALKALMEKETGKETGKTPRSRQRKTTASAKPS